jgi:hypothetical protein
MRSYVRHLAIAALPALLVGCASARPAPGTYTVDFPSELTAITTDDVQVFVYAYDDTPDLCTTLVEETATGSPVASPIASTPQVSPCALEAGGNPLPVGFGQYAFLAVASRQAYGNYLIGCAAQTMSATNTNVSIPLQLVDFTNMLPTTMCTMLSQKCSGQSC